ncbi:MAG TPA: L-lactate permease [Gemmatimonadaceae bacterium]|nr:L-lactate permease [Gemmatimonadaceae bacterium]
MPPWSQRYDPLGSPLASTLVAALPVVVLLGALASGRVRAHVAALLGLATAILCATLIVGMPWSAAAAAAVMGACYGLLPIGWIILNTIFLYQLTKEQGAFDRMKASIAGVSDDKRVQLVLIAFALGAFFEGAAGFGTPVAITGAILIGLGFGPLEASGLSLLANTAPVAFGAMGTPILALAGVTGIDAGTLSRMVGRQLPMFSLVIPFWLIAAYDGRRGVRELWPVLLIAGLSFAVPQFLLSNYHGPWLVDVVSGLCCILCTALFAGNRGRARPSRVTRDDTGNSRDDGTLARDDGIAWTPWIVLSIVVFVWGLQPAKAWLNRVFAPQVHVPWLDGIVQRVPPVVAAPQVEAAVYSFNLLSATGTAILIAAIISGFVLRYDVRGLARAYGRTLAIVWPSLVTIAAMLALGYVTRYSGLDAILGLACARTGVLYPIFGTMLGWLGVAVTGSDTSSNVLFGSLQKITATQLGLSPVLMSAANSSGGVMGKMIDAQSIVVASTATRWYGHESRILRFVFLHSVALALLVGLLVTLQAYVPPFTALVP